MENSNHKLQLPQKTGNAANCGKIKIKIMKYCSKCGAEIHDDAVICPKCGCAVEGQGVLLGKSEKKWITTFLLCFFLGVIGAHRFYVGRTGSGIAMLLTVGGLGIWAFVDLIVILCGNFKDSSGARIKNS